MRSAVDEYDHAVSEELTVIGMQAGQGRYEAVCGHTVEVTPMTVENGPHCTRCWSLVQARRATGRGEPVRARRGWITRILQFGLIRQS